MVHLPDRVGPDALARPRPRNPLLGPGRRPTVFAICFIEGNLPKEWKCSYFLMAAIHLAILGIAAGRTLGLAQLLRPRTLGSSILTPACRLVVAPRVRLLPW
jgi:hypothetical protein